MSQFFKGAIGGGVIGNVVGPASSTDNAIVRFDGTTGKLLQNSSVIIDDIGNIDSNSTDSGNTKSITLQNNVDVAGSATKISQLVGGSSAGDVYNEFAVGAITSYALGIDNSDSDIFKLTTAAAANVDPSSGTSLLEITNAGQVSFPAATLTEFGVMVVGSSGLLTSTAVGVAGQILTSNGPGLAPTYQAGASGTVTSVSGTINRISSTGGATPVIDIDAAYVGQASITTLGTVTTGVWNGTDIAVADGGTGVSALTGIAVGNGTANFVGRTITGTADYIDVTNGDGVAGNPTLSIATNFMKTGKNAWDGAILETARVMVTSDGSTATFNIEQSSGGDLTVVFSTGFYDWDTTPAATVALTAGSDTSPQLNYVYLLESTKALTASTVGWPATEHAPLATVLCQSAASVQVDGVYKMHAWTDHVVSTNNMGHISHLNYWIRQQSATYVSGLVQTYTINAATDPDEVTIATTAGVALQLHPHDVPAFAAADDMYVINDSVTPYTIINDLNEITLDSTGASLSNRYYSLVMWIAVSEDAADCKRFINLPGGSYGSESELLSDPDNYANYTIPTEFVGTGVLVSEWKLRKTAPGSGTFTSVQEIDLRGLLPVQNAGGSGSGEVEFPDNTFRIFDEGDPSKEIAFQASGITTATTRTLTVQDADGTIALSGVANFGTGAQTFNVYGPVVAGATTTTALASVVPSAATGIAFVSQGSAANPVFGTVVEAGGGTNQTTYTQGDILYASAANTLSKLAKGTTGDVLTQTATIPSWAAPAAGSVLSVQAFTATGAFTYTPTAGMQYVIVELLGAGGGSGGCAATSANMAIAGSGGGGAYAKFLLTAAQVGASLAGSVGAGGAGGASGNNNGATGGSTTLATAAAWTCAGGDLGVGSPASSTYIERNGAAGGAVTPGTGTVLFTAIGGKSEIGGGTASTWIIVGKGGDTILGFPPSGAILATVPQQAIAGSGVGYGTGARGAGSFGTVAAHAGAAGADGIAIFTEYS